MWRDGGHMREWEMDGDREGERHIERGTERFLHTVKLHVEFSNLKKETNPQPCFYTIVRKYESTHECTVQHGRVIISRTC